MQAQDSIPTAGLIGRHIVLDKELGHGSMGEVWLASLTPLVALPARIITAPTAAQVLPTNFVVKVTRSELMSTPRDMLLALHEVEALEKQDHPFVVRYFFSWVEDGANPFNGCLCIAMEFCQYGDLRSLLRRKKERGDVFPNEILMLCAAQLLSAVAYCHSKHILHRDIKPANVFVSRRNANQPSSLALGDFGLSRGLEHTQQTAMSRVGTPLYCSPEIVLGKEYTNKTDIWSIGVVLYEMMTLQSPFWSPATTNDQVYRRIVNENPIPALIELSEGKFSNTMVNIVSACLAKEESKRPTAMQLLTSFSQTMSSFVKDNAIPVPVARAQSPLLAQQGSPPSAAHDPKFVPTRKCSPLPERISSPLRCGKPFAAPQQIVKPATRHSPPSRVAALPSAEKHKDCADSSLEKVSSYISSLMPAQATELFTNSSSVLRALLHNDEELILLVKMMALTRQAMPASYLEEGLFKLIVALKPEVDASRAIEVITKKKG